MKLAKYYIENKTGNNTFLYNTLTSSFIKVDSEYWEHIKTILSNDVTPDNKLLFEGGFLIDDDIDELQKYKYLYYSKSFNGLSLKLYIAPTMKCNFGCRYCFEGENKKHGLMDKSIEENLIKFIKVQIKKYKRVNIVWFGGEPLMGYTRMLSISRHLKQENIEYSSSMITNGSLLTQNVIANLDDLNLTFIQISMDGVAKDHDRRRTFKNGHPSFELIMNNLSNLLSQTEIPVVIQVTMDHDNPDAYDDIVEYAKTNYGKYLESKRLQIGLNYVQNRTGFDKTSTCYSDADILRHEISELKSSKNDDVVLPGISLPCMFRNDSYFAIDPNGDILKCIEHLGCTDNKIGSVATGKMSLSKLAATTFAEDPFLDEECINCAVFPICGGGCPIDRIKARSDVEKNYCSMYKENLSTLLPLLYEHKYKTND